MKTQKLLVSIVTTAVLLLGMVAGSAAAQAPDADPAGVTAVALGTVFSYQGQLIKDGAPVNGTCDVRFILYESGAGGSQVGPIVEKLAVVVTGGLFTVPDLDFGSGVFVGDRRWLEVAVKCPAGSGSYATVGDRQELAATPYALYAPSAGNAATATNATSAASAPWSGLSGVPAGFADGMDNDTTYSAGTGLTLTGTVFTPDTTYLQRRVSGTCAAGSSIRVVSPDGTVTCETDDTGWALTGNAGTTPGTNYLGTSDSKALEFKVNGGRALRLEPNATSPNLVGGYSGSWLTSGVYGATIGGGGYSGHANRVTDAVGTVGGGADNQAGDNAGTTEDATYATVGGGLNNVASGSEATVGGGTSNVASGDYATVGGGGSIAAGGSYATVGGGGSNAANGIMATVGGGGWNTAGGADSTVGGGNSNVASGQGAVIAGGSSNTASGAYAMVAGGVSNVTSGLYSFAAGYRAKATYQGSFVWADSTDADFSPSGQDTFNVRATGGATFQVSSDPGFWVYNTANATGMGVVGWASSGNSTAALEVENIGSSPAIWAYSMYGTYAGYFMNDIYVSGNCTGCSLAYVATNTGKEALEIGALVAPNGVQSPLTPGGQPVLAVRRASADGACGVVAGRAALVESVKDGKTSVSAEAAQGTIAPGDHLFIIVSGLAQARVDAAAGPIAAGQRLTTANAGGRGRALRTVSVEGVSVAEAAPVIGMALEPLPAGQRLIWVLVGIH